MKTKKRRLWFASILAALCMVVFLVPMTASAATGTEYIYVNADLSSMSYTQDATHTDKLALFVYGDEGDTYELTEAVPYLVVTNAAVTIGTGGEIQQGVFLSGTASVQRDGYKERAIVAAIPYDADAQTVATAFMAIEDKILTDLEASINLTGDRYDVKTNAFTLTIPANEVLTIYGELDATGGSVTGAGKLIINKDATYTGIDLYEADGTTPWTNTLAADGRDFQEFILLNGKWQIMPPAISTDYTLVLYGREQYKNSVDAANIIPGGLSGVSWDPVSSKWKFEDFYFETSAETAVEIKEDCVLVLKGNSMIRGGDGNPEDGITYGIYTAHSLIIEGDGALTVTAGNIADYSSGSSYGIFASNGFEFRSGTLTATGGNVLRDSYGIYTYSGNGTLISGGSVTAIGGNTDAISTGFYHGYSNQAFEITAGNLTATGGNSTNGNSRGLRVEVKDDTNFAGGTVTATGGAGMSSYGIDVGDGNATFSGSDVTATGGIAANSSYGIQVSPGTATFSDGTIVATGGSNADDISESYGIYAESDVTVSGATVTATGGDTRLSKGLYIEDGGNLTVTAGSLNATGGSASDDSSYGIHVDKGNASFIGGSVTAQGGEATAEDSNGIYVDGDTTISGGDVSATGADGARSVGFYSEANFNITGGSLTAIGGDTDYSEYAMSYGLYVRDNADFAGGTVTAQGGNSDEESCGIIGYGNITVSGADIEATGGDAGYSAGLYAYDTFEITAGSLTAEAGDAAEYSSDGIYIYGDAVFAGGTVTAQGGNSDEESYGIFGDGNITVSGADIEARGGDAGYYSAGLYVETFEITAGSLNATGGEASDGSSYGIHVDEGNASFIGGSVTAQGGEATVTGNGIYVAGDTTISGGDVSATGGNSDYFSAGIEAKGAVDISGAAIEAKGGKGAYSAGFYAYSSFEITAGSLTAEGNDASYYSSDGITVENDAVFAGGTVRAAAGKAGEDYASYGISVLGNIILSGGTVTSQATEGDGECYGIAVQEQSTVTVTGGDITLMGNTMASAELNTNTAINSPMAPRTTRMLVKASGAADGTGAADVENWVGDGTDDTADYRYMRLTPIPPLPATAPTPAAGPPKTGDESNMLLWFVLMAVAVCGATATVKRAALKRSSGR